MTRPTAVPAILADIRLSHSIFALPFAFVGLLVGTRGEWPDASLLLRIVAAMVLARSAAMGFNRWADRDLDATNPRTEGRALPSGRVRPGTMLAFALVSAAGFIAVAGTFNTPCLLLSPVVLAIVFGYSLTKRFTAAAHLCVGLALALSPPAAYLAARGDVAWDVVVVLWLSLAVLCWVAGFDIIYACQDVAHDRREGLHSIPARWGVGPALWIARGLHLVMLVALSRTVTLGGLGALSWVAIGMMAVLLVIEHALVAGGDLSRVNAAFFTVNGIVGLVFGVFVGADLLWP